MRSARYDRLAGSVMIDGRGYVLEVAHEAIEVLMKRELEPQEAIDGAIREAKRLTRLAGRLPADDGKIIVTRSILLKDGQHDGEEGEAQ